MIPNPGLNGNPNIHNMHFLYTQPQSGIMFTKPHRTWRYGHWACECKKAKLWDSQSVSHAIQLSYRPPRVLLKYCYLYYLGVVTLQTLLL